MTSNATSTGRPRSKEKSRAILEAAIEVFCERGFDGLTIEDVAARAGVGKTTVYRRWASKEELVTEAIDRLVAPLQQTDTGSVRTDLVAVVTTLQGFLRGSDAGRILPQVAGEVAQQRPLGRLYVDRVVKPRRAHVAEILRRGIERGEIAPDVDADLVVDQIVGSILVRTLMGTGGAFDPGRVVDQMLSGIAAAD